MILINSGIRPLNSSYVIFFCFCKMSLDILKDGNLQGKVSVNKICYMNSNTKVRTLNFLKIFFLKEFRKTRKSS